MPRHRFTDTRDRIEKAAIRLFVEKGVDRNQRAGYRPGGRYF